jgi:hypothetical protein
VAAAKPASEPDAQASALTADLFYEILMGELTTRSGDPGSGYALVLDAARRLRDGKLFQRAVEIALQSRSGDARWPRPAPGRKRCPPRAMHGASNCRF